MRILEALTACIQLNKTEVIRSTAIAAEDAKEAILSYTNTEGAIAQWPVYYTANWADMMAVSDSVIDSVWTGDGSAAEILGSVMDEMKAAFEK